MLAFGMDDERQISLSLEGVLDLSTHASTTRALQTLLSDVEEQVTGERAKIYWSIPDRSDVVAVATPNGVDAGTIDDVMASAVRGFESVKVAEGRDVKWPDTFGPKSKKAVKRILRALNSVSAISVFAGEQEPVIIRHVVVQEEYGEERQPDEYGSVDGKLDLISVRSQLLFSVEEHGTGRHIRCTIGSEKLFGQAKNLLGARVVAEGMLRFAKNGEVTSIYDVRSLWCRPALKTAPDELVGALSGFTGGEDAADYVRGLRDEEDG